MPFGGADVSRVLVSAMKVAELNHRVIANNIANSDTPHFSPTALDFQRTLKAAVAGGGDHVALRTSRSRHQDRTRVHTELERKSILSKNDYNQVDLEEEVSRLAENRGRYTVYSRLLTKKYQMAGELLDSLAR